MSDTTERETPPPVVRNMAGEPTDPSRDLVAVAARGLAAGLLAGTGVEAFVLWALRLLLAGAPAADRPVVTGPGFYVLVLGTMLAMVTAGAAAYHWLAPIGSPFRRGTLAMVAGLGTFAGALLLTVLYHVLGESLGLGIHVLAGLGVLFLAAGLRLAAGRQRA